MRDEQRILIRFFMGIFSIIRWIATPIIAIIVYIWERIDFLILPIYKLLKKVFVPFGKWNMKWLRPLGGFFTKVFGPISKAIAKVAIILWDYINIGLEFVWKYVKILAKYLWIVFVFVTKPLVIINDFLYRILPAWVKALLSGLIWGLGQLFNKQFIKASMFFLVFFTVVGIEITTGNYGVEYDFFKDKLAGEEVEEEFANGLIEYYFFNYDVNNNPLTGGIGEDYLDPLFLHYVGEVNDVAFDEVTIWFYEIDGYETNGDPILGDALSQRQFQRLTLSRDQMYDFAGEALRIVEEQGNSVEQLELDAQAQAEADIHANTEEDIYEIARRDSRADLTATGYDALLPGVLEDIANLTYPTSGFTGTLQEYIQSNIDTFTLQAQDIIFTNRYNEIYDDYYDNEYARNYQQDYSTKYKQYYNAGFGDIVIAESDFIRAFDDYLYEKFSSGQLKNENGFTFTNVDANKMLLRILYSYDTQAYEDLLAVLNNPFYEQGGYFVKGAWGVFTLGSVPQKSLTTQRQLEFLLPNTGSKSLDFTFMEIKGHNSTQLLLEGIIALIVVFYLALIFFWNVKDAYVTAKKSKIQGKVQNEKEYFKDLYEDFFEYIVLTPALLLVSFISVMPIFFGLAVAFTNFAAIPGNTHIPPGQLIDWVGFENFGTVFNLTSGSTIDFAGNFWSVFSWTLIWAVAATFTCFFGGFVQAVIISNKRVAFRKAWRAILILPWAVPALISQMIFRVMFNDNGYVNTTLNGIGVTEFFRDLDIFGLKFIGPSHVEAMNLNAFQRFFYMGEDTFQWLSNEANPWFVRIFIIILNIWLGFPFFMALMSGVMTSIDKSLYEAASIDGATGFQQFKFITMPLVLFATSPLLVMTFSGNFNNFGVIYFITGGGPGGGTIKEAYAGSTDILISWIYKLTTDNSIRWYNMASVFSILIFLIIGSLSAWNFTRTRAFKEGD